MIKLDSEAIMKKRSRKQTYPSLFDTFKPGDRVIRKGNQKKHDRGLYEGIIMSMDIDYLQVYWDKKDGIYSAEPIDERFTTCPIDEVLHGNDEYSSIKPKKS